MSDKDLATGLLKSLYTNRTKKYQTEMATQLQSNIDYNVINASGYTFKLQSSGSPDSGMYQVIATINNINIVLYEFDGSPDVEIPKWLEGKKGGKRKSKKSKKSKKNKSRRRKH